jgi:hypothetical protein
MHSMFISRIWEKATAYCRIVLGYTVGCNDLTTLLSQAFVGYKVWFLDKFKKIIFFSFFWAILSAFVNLFAFFQWVQISIKLCVLWCPYEFLQKFILSLSALFANFEAERGQNGSKNKQKTNFINLSFVKKGENGSTLIHSHRYSFSTKLLVPLEVHVSVVLTAWVWSAWLNLMHYIFPVQLRVNACLGPGRKV